MSINQHLLSRLLLSRQNYSDAMTLEQSRRQREAQQQAATLQAITQGLKGVPGIINAVQGEDEYSAERMAELAAAQAIGSDRPGTPGAVPTGVPGGDAQPDLATQDWSDRDIVANMLKQPGMSGFASGQGPVNDPVTRVDTQPEAEAEPFQPLPAAPPGQPPAAMRSILDRQTGEGAFEAPAAVNPAADMAAPKPAADTKSPADLKDQIRQMLKGGPGDADAVPGAEGAASPEGDMSNQSAEVFVDPMGKSMPGAATIPGMPGIVSGIGAAMTGRGRGGSDGNTEALSEEMLRAEINEEIDGRIPDPAVGHTVSAMNDPKMADAIERLLARAEKRTGFTPLTWETNEWDVADKVVTDLEQKYPPHNPFWNALTGGRADRDRDRAMTIARAAVVTGLRKHRTDQQQVHLKAWAQQQGAELQGTRAELAGFQALAALARATSTGTSKPPPLRDVEKLLSTNRTLGDVQDLYGLTRQMAQRKEPIPLSSALQLALAANEMAAADIRGGSVTVGGSVLGAGAAGGISQPGKWFESEQFNEAFERALQTNMSDSQRQWLGQLRTIIQSLGKEREGGRMTDRDLQFYLQNLVDPNSPGVTMRRIGQLTEKVEENNRILFEALSANYDMGRVPSVQAWKWKEGMEPLSEQEIEDLQAWNNKRWVTDKDGNRVQVDILDETAAKKPTKPNPIASGIADILEPGVEGVKKLLDIKAPPPRSGRPKGRPSPSLTELLQKELSGE